MNTTEQIVVTTVEHAKLSAIVESLSSAHLALYQADSVANPLTGVIPDDVISDSERKQLEALKFEVLGLWATLRSRLSTTKVL